jgi:dolichol-phosphate mannosyltransferase
VSSAHAQLLMVVPTYNEIENVGTLVERIETIRDACPVDVLFVDDGSPDGTGSLIHSLRETRSWIHILERTGRMGLGSAYRAGFAWGRGHGYERIGEMDADLSHDPAYLPALDAAARGGADLALGSRYTKGGGSEGWPLKRRFLSRGANVFARTLLRLPTHDVTGGYRIYDAGAIDLLLRQGTECDGYGFQVEGVTAVTRAGLRITEVPIVFRDRTFGTSKMSMSTVWEATRRCFALAFETQSAADAPMAASVPGGSADGS